MMTTLRMQVSGIEDGIIQGPYDDVLGATHGESDRSNLGESSFVQTLGSYVGTNIGAFDRITGGNIVNEIEVF